MVCLILLSACIISGVATGKVYIDIHKFIKTSVKPLAWKMNLDYKEMLEMFDADLAFNYKLLIPIVNYFHAMIEFGSMILNYNNLKDNVYKISPEFQYQDDVRLEHETDGDLNEKQDFFVGRTIDGKVQNIYFDYDGKYINIKDYSASNFIALTEDMQKEELFNLLSEWYYGGYKYLNGSSNISHVFDEKVVEAVKSIYYGNVDYVVEYEQKLTRKR